MTTTVSDAGLMMYLCEKKELDESDAQKHLLLYITLNAPAAKASLRKSQKLSNEEVIILVSLEQEDKLKTKLFSIFGITSLASSPGYPKGLDYSVGKDVYQYFSLVRSRKLEGIDWIEYRLEGRIKYAPTIDQSNPVDALQDVFLEKDETGNWVRWERDYGRLDPTYYKVSLTSLDQKILDFSNPF